MITFFLKIASFFKKSINAWRMLSAEKTTTFANVQKPPKEIALTFADGAVQLIMKLRGWESQAQMARGLDITPAFLSQVINGQRHVSHMLMCRIVVALNLKDGAWWTLFKWVEVGDYDGNAKKFNQAKIDGEMPYENTPSLPDRPENDMWVRPERWRKNSVNAELELIKGTNTIRREKEEIKAKRTRRKQII